MKCLVSVELLEEHQAVNFYAIRFTDEEKSLFDQFLTQFSTDEFERDIATITYWIDKIGVTGALERHFRLEGHPKVKAIPIAISNLRLYCFRISDQILILGGGDEKNVRAYQDDTVLDTHVKVVKKTGIKLLRYIEQNKVTKNGKSLTGKLSFEIDI